jgi:ribonuclease J
MMYLGLKFAKQIGIGTKRQERFTPGKPFHVGHFTITAYAVDHSAFDSMAFLIEAEGKRILYSGDLRLHGRKPGMAEQLIKATSAQPLHAVVMEGTHVTPDRRRGITEWDLEEELVEHIQGAKGIVLANFSPLHVDRLVGFFRAAERTKRTFIADPYAALVMHKAAKRCRVPDPVKDRTIRIYYCKAFEETFKKKGMSYVHKRRSRPNPGRHDSSR